MENLRYEYPATRPVPQRAHVGVVGSGDLEILLSPSESQHAEVVIRTSVDGYEHVWKSVLDRFFSRYDGAARLDRALPLLDCMISVDNWLNETTRHAHVILPGLSPLEQPHFDDLLWTLAVRSAAKWSDPVFEPEAGRPAEWEILIRLAAICSGTRAADVDVAAIDDGLAL